MHTNDGDGAAPDGIMLGNAYPKAQTAKPPPPPPRHFMMDLKKQPHSVLCDDEHDSPYCRVRLQSRLSLCCRHNDSRLGSRPRIADWAVDPGRVQLRHKREVLKVVVD